MNETIFKDGLTEEEFVRERITQLRLSRNISEYQLSYDLGHSRGYINNISSGKTLPSMTEFLNMCYYFENTPMEFFDKRIKRPEILHEVNLLFPTLEEDSQLLVLQLIQKIRDKNA